MAGKLHKSILRICEEIKDSKGLKTDEKAPFTDSNLVFCFDVLRFEESSEPNSNHCGIIWWQNSAEIKMLKVIFDTLNNLSSFWGVFFSFFNFLVSCHEVTF